MQRRILVVLLPSLEKAPAELASLGKISLSAIRNACAVGLGAQIEGDAADTLEALPTDAIGIGPYLCIVDEYAAIVTPGFEVVLTQGRGLGIAAIVASQDYAGIFKADEKGAQQMVANTSIKAFMPPDIEAVDIGIKFGSTWVPGEVLADFIEERIHGGRGHQTINYVPILGRWEAKVSVYDHEVVFEGPFSVLQCGGIWLFPALLYSHKASPAFLASFLLRILVQYLFHTGYGRLFCPQGLANQVVAQKPARWCLFFRASIERQRS